MPRMALFSPSGTPLVNPSLKEFKSSSHQFFNVLAQLAGYLCSCVQCN